MVKRTDGLIKPQVNARYRRRPQRANTGQRWQAVVPRLRNQTEHAVERYRNHDEVGGDFFI